MKLFGIRGIWTLDWSTRPGLAIATKESVYFGTLDWSTRPGLAIATKESVYFIFIYLHI